jgi:hypothetical protein
MKIKKFTLALTCLLILLLAACDAPLSDRGQKRPSSSLVHQVHDRMMVQYAKKGVLYASEDHFVYSSADGGNIWKQICVLEPRQNTIFAHAKNFLLRSEMVRKIRRNIGINNVAVLPSGTVIVQYDGIYRFDGTGAYANHVYDFGPQNILGPLKNGLAVDERTGDVYFGEYNIKRPYSVRIVRGRDDGRKWGICYRFPEGKIRHVHSIVFDPYRNRLWVCTGDSDREAQLFYTDDGFKTLKQFGGFSQMWRMVSLLPTRDSIIWGSDAGGDAPLADNYIYRYRFSDRKVEKLQYINKPAYYATRLSDGTMVIGTTFEPGQRGVAEKSADIWASGDGEHWERVATFPFSPAGRSSGTRFGTLNFPAGDGSLDSLFLTPLNARDSDFTLQTMRPDTFRK